MTIWNPGYTSFTYFWCGKDGPFSQWEHSYFELDGLMYNCAEQYMMACKADLFKDVETSDKILNSASPKEQKALGRQVKNFDEKKWNSIAKVVVYRGNYAKYTQNLDMLASLLATKDSLLVEASPYDKLWGIGLSAEKAAMTYYKDWPGQNWLGEVLTKVRDDLLKVV